MGILSSHLPGLSEDSGDGKVITAMILHKEGVLLMHLFLKKSCFILKRNKFHYTYPGGEMLFQIRRMENT